MTERIGFVGVRLTGHGMAKNLVQKDFPLTMLAFRIAVEARERPAFHRPHPELVER